MKAVVTGATSFIGVPLIRQLISQGWTVFAMARPGSKNIGRLETLSPGLFVTELELGEVERLHEIIPQPCDVFFHFGWEGAGSDNRKNRKIQQKNAVDSMKALYEAKTLGCRRFLFSGSQAEYGLHHGIMTEQTECAPVSEYGKAKAEFGKKAAETAGEWNRTGESTIEYIHTRIFSIYGPGDHPWSLVETCLRTFLSGGVMDLGECSQMWNFLYVEDLVRACSALADCEENAAGVYNIAGGCEETRPLREYVEKIHDLCGRKGSCRFGVRPPNAEGAANLIPDIGRITGRTGWRPRVTFEEGIGRMLRLKKEFVR